MAPTPQGLQYRCPHCGTVNDDESLSFPNCGGCREHLFKCAYCQHFPGLGQLCGAFPRRPLTATTVVPECPARASTLRVGLLPALLRPLSGRWLSGVTVTVFGLIVALASLLNTEVPRRETPQLTVSALLSRRSLRVGQKVTLSLFLENGHETQPAHFRVRLPSRCFFRQVEEVPAGMFGTEATFKCTDISPPTATELMPSSALRSFSFPPLSGRDFREIYFQFIALTAGSGRITVEVEVLGGDSRHYQYFDLPVQPGSPAAPAAVHQPTSPPVRRGPKQSGTNSSRKEVFS